MSEALRWLQAVRDDETAFRNFLISRGAEILTPLSKYDRLRFSGPHGVCVVYQSENGIITYANADAIPAIRAFAIGGQWRACAAVSRKSVSEQKRASIIERDGACCIYCGHVGSDDNPLTSEHVVAVTCGGPNHIANRAIACKSCNQAVGAMSAAEKIRYAVRLATERFRRTA